jgi:hypothetical protein
VIYSTGVDILPIVAAAKNISLENQTQIVKLLSTSSLRCGPLISISVVVWPGALQDTTRLSLRQAVWRSHRVIIQSEVSSLRQLEFDGGHRSCLAISRGRSIGPLCRVHCSWHHCSRFKQSYRSLGLNKTNLVRWLQMDMNADSNPGSQHVKVGW